MPRIPLAAVLCAAAALVACSSSTTPEATPPAVGVAVSPAAATVLTGRTVQLTATVENDPAAQGVTWTASSGVVDASGLFTAPGTPATVTVTATSRADAARSAAATITVALLGVGIAPTAVAVPTGATQQFTATVTGWPETAITWSASAGTISSAGVLTAPATAGDLTVTATSVADPTKSAVANVTVFAPEVPAPVVVGVAPSSVTLRGGEQRQFTATVANAASGAVTWSATAGTITTGGLFIAPAGPATVTVRATSVADPTKSATAEVTVPANQPPLADAGADQAVVAGAAVTLAGAGQDPDGSVEGVAWVQTAGPAVTLAGATSASASFTAPAVTQETVLGFRFTVRDDSGASASDTVTVTVRPPVRTGVLLDAAVGGIHFETPTFAGFTGLDGSFQYLDGESVTFSIGATVFTTIPADRVLTPLSLVPGALEITNPAVTNITRFLQTLDEDLDPANGIVITRQTYDAVAATGVALDFEQSTVGFETDPDVHAVLVAAGATISGLSGLVDIEEAREHLRRTLDLLPPQPAQAMQGSTLLGGSWDENSIRGFVTPEGGVGVVGRTRGFAGLDLADVLHASATPLATEYRPFVAELAPDLRTLRRAAVLTDGFDSVDAVLSLPDGRLLVSGPEVLELAPDWQSVRVVTGSVPRFWAACASATRIVLVGMTTLAIHDHDLQALGSYSLPPGSHVSARAADCGGADVLVAGTVYDESWKSDAFLARYGYDGGLTGSARLGSSDDDWGTGVGRLSDGRVVLGGTTFWNDRARDTDFPAGTPGTLKTRMPDRYRDGFVAIYSADLATRERLTLIGGDDFVDNVDALRVDAGDYIHVSGMTLSDDFPYTEGVGAPAFGSTASHYAKITPALDRYVHASPIAMTPEGGLHVDAVGNATLIGYTNYSGYLTTPDAYQTTSLPPDPANGPTNWDVAVARYWVPGG
jgi:hypothetical protein